MRIFLSVGEPSGDLHGANLIRDLRERNPSIEFAGFGGPRMEEAGCGLLYDLTALAVMGLWNVLIHIRKFFSLLDDADEYFANHRVDAVVLIDYPGFNWWIARKARKHGIPVFYYGVPQMWAWLPWRVRKLRRLVDHVLCKLPFEVAWFEQRGCQATYVGHPYFDELVRYEYDEAFRQQLGSQPGRLLVLLPGSRTQEVHRNLPDMIEATSHVAARHPDLRVAVACFRESHRQYAEALLQGASFEAALHTGKTPELISMADVCIACSGSVSLELLYHRTPTVIVYRVGYVVMMLQYLLLRTRFITLVNMFGRQRIEKSAIPRYDRTDPDWDVPMPEFLGCRNYSRDVADWIDRWLNQEATRQAKIGQLDELAEQFVEAGASRRAANYILDRMKEYDDEHRLSDQCQRRVA